MGGLYGSRDFDIGHRGILRGSWLNLINVQPLVCLKSLPFYLLTFPSYIFLVNHVFAGGTGVIQCQT